MWSSRASDSNYGESLRRRERRTVGDRNEDKVLAGKMQGAQISSSRLVGSGASVCAPSRPADSFGAPLLPLVSLVLRRPPAPTLFGPGMRCLSSRPLFIFPQPNIQGAISAYRRLLPAPSAALARCRPVPLCSPPPPPPTLA